MSAWNGPGKAGTGGSPEFVHVDAAGTSPSDKSSAASAQKPKPPNSSQRGRGNGQANGGASSSNSASNWQATISRLLDITKPEDATAIRRLGEDVRAGGTNGARAVVELLRLRIGEKNANAETRSRAIAIARVLAQRSVSGADAQRLIAAPPFVATLKQAASDPNVRNSLKTWASQIRIGDPNDASMLTPITGLDEHLAQAGETASLSSESSRRPPPLNPGGPSFVPHPPPSEDPDEDNRTGVRVHTTGNRNAGESMAAAAAAAFNASMPGGFGLDGSTFEAGPSMVAAGPGGLPTVREFPPSSIQPLPPSMGVPRPSLRSGWADEDDGMQSDAPSTRSRRTTAQVMQGAFAATPSMDGGRGARDRLNERNPRNENGRGRSTRTSSLADGTLSEPEEPSPRGRHPGIPATIPEDPRVYGQRVPAPMPMPTQQRGRSRHPSVSPDRSGLRSRSPSPSTTTRSRMRSRSRARSRRRGTGPGVDPAVVLVNLAGVQFVRVTQEYYAAREGELTLREGEVLAVIRREDGGRYWLGHSQGQVGRFPAEVVELLSHQRDPGAQEEKTADLLRRSREIDDFMDQLHDFDITRYCITEDRDIQGDLAALLGLRNELVRHLDETTTGMGRLKAMLNKIKEAQRVHDRMIDSRIAGYTARSSLHDATPRNHYQELPPNPMQYAPFDMSQYMRRTAATQQIEQPPPAQSPPLRQQPQIGMYNGNPAAALRLRQAQEMGYPPRAGAPARSRTYSYTPAAPPPHAQAQARRMDDEQSSAYVSSEPTTPGETSSLPPVVGAAPANGGAPQYAFPPQQNGGERWGEHPKDADQDAGRQRARGSHVSSESSAHTHASRRGAF